MMITIVLTFIWTLVYLLGSTNLVPRKLYNTLMSAENFLTASFYYMLWSKYRSAFNEVKTFIKGNEELSQKIKSMNNAIYAAIFIVALGTMMSVWFNTELIDMGLGVIGAAIVTGALLEVVAILVFLKFILTIKKIKEWQGEY